VISGRLRVDLIGARPAGTVPRTLVCAFAFVIVFATGDLAGAALASCMPVDAASMQPPTISPTIERNSILPLGS
jgi:hypothetical protein